MKNFRSTLNPTFHRQNLVQKTNKTNNIDRNFQLNANPIEHSNPKTDDKDFLRLKPNFSFDNHSELKSKCKKKRYFRISIEKKPNSNSFYSQHKTRKCFVSVLKSNRMINSVCRADCSIKKRDECVNCCFRILQNTSRMTMTSNCSQHTRRPSFE